MKRISFFTLLCLIAIPVLAEQVSVVTFNPSRLGEYQHLKVTDSATLRGGLSTPRFEVGAGAAVLLDNQTTDKQVLFGDIVGRPGDTGEMTINMPQALFRKDGDIFPASYRASHAHNPSANLLLPQINAVGGRMEFTNDSFVNNLTRQITGANPNDILLQANQLDVSGDMEVTGRGIVRVLGADGNLSGSLTNVFQLGEYKIPYPNTVQHRSGNNRSTVDLAPENYAGFNLAWVERKQTDGTLVRVLALVGSIEPPCNEEWVIHEKQVDCFAADDSEYADGWSGYAIRKYRTRCHQGETETQYWDLNAEEWFTPTTEEEIFATDDQTHCHKYCWVSNGGETSDYTSDWVWGTKGLQNTECKGLSAGTLGSEGGGHSLILNEESCRPEYPGSCRFYYCGRNYKVIHPDPDKCHDGTVGWTSYWAVVHPGMAFGMGHCVGIKIPAVCYDHNVPGTSANAPIVYCTRVEKEYLCTKDPSVIEYR